MSIDEEGICMDILFAGLMLFIQIWFFFSIGSLVLRAINKKISCITMAFLWGIVYGFSIFPFFAVPFTIANLPLSSLTYTWMAVNGIIVVLSGIFCYKNWITALKSIMKKVRAHGWLLLVLGIAILIQMWVVAIQVDASADASYYVGKVATDVYTNTIGHFSPYTGGALQKLETTRLFSCFPEYNAVISQFFHIHPLIQAKLIMPEIIILAVNIIYYHIGLALFNGNVKKADGTVCFAFLFNWYSNTNFTSSTFLFTRTYEGKAILANLILPFMVYCFIKFWKNQDTLFYRLLLLGISMSSCVFSTSAMFILPVGLAAGILPWAIKEKKYQMFGWYFIYIFPQLLTLILYMLTKNNILVFQIN